MRIIQAVHTKYNTNAGLQEHSVIKKAIFLNIFFKSAYLVSSWYPRCPHPSRRPADRHTYPLPTYMCRIHVPLCQRRSRSLARYNKAI